MYMEQHQTGTIHKSKHSTNPSSGKDHSRLPVYNQCQNLGAVAFFLTCNIKKFSNFPSPPLQCWVACKKNNACNWCLLLLTNWNALHGEFRHIALSNIEAEGGGGWANDFCQWLWYLQCSQLGHLLSLMQVYQS